MMNKLAKTPYVRATWIASSVERSFFCVKRFVSSIDDGSDQSNGVCSTSEDPEDAKFKTNFNDDISEDEISDVDQMKAMNPNLQGIYKAVLMGEAGYAPSQKTMRNGSTVTMFSLGTSGMRNNRRPFENETPDEYAKRSMVQWHRVAVYQYKLGALVMKLLKKGSQVYVEGNIETRVFFDPESKIIKRIQEIAVRQNGRIIFLDQNSAEVAKNSR